MIVSLFGRSARFKRFRIPFFFEYVSTGFTTPAQGYVEQTLGLNELWVKHPVATFFVLAEGDSMVEAGIFANNALSVESSHKAEHNGHSKGGWSAPEYGYSSLQGNGHSRRPRSYR